MSGNWPFDAAVMLTWSNWRTEMRSNRYHYATRFARHLPVIFVQADLDEPRFHFEDTEVSGVVLLHVYAHHGLKQCSLLFRALGQKGVRKPLLWVYNPHFVHFIEMCAAPLTVYHATEDYFSPLFQFSGSELKVLRTVLRLSDMLVAVSEGVKSSYVNKGEYGGTTLVLANGCDFKFWGPQAGDPDLPSLEADRKRSAFYQGGIHRKIDFVMMEEIVRRMPDWEFWFCGEVYPGLPEWDSLSRYPNVTYHGRLSPAEVRSLAYRATVGLIPFIQHDYFIERSCPLKAFEYVASGLPVVGVPIKALQPFREVFTFAHTASQFVDAIRASASTRYNAEAVAQRLKIARAQDYDLKFESLLSVMISLAPSNRSRRGALHAFYVRRISNVKSILEEGKRAMFQLEKRLAVFVIHFCAKAMAAVSKRDPGQLEQEMIMFCKKVWN